MFTRVLEVDLDSLVFVGLLRSNGGGGIAETGNVFVGIEVSLPRSGRLFVYGT